jgi:hypothetical protein
MKPTDDGLEHLLGLNKTVAAAIEEGLTVDGPGLPSCIGDHTPFLTADAYSA